MAFRLVRGWRLLLFALILGTPATGLGSDTTGLDDVQAVVAAALGPLLAGTVAGLGRLVRGGAGAAFVHDALSCVSG